MGFVRMQSIGLSLVMVTTALGAQATPLLFSVTPTAGPSKSLAAYGYYELGYGERTFEPVAGDRIEQAVGMRATSQMRSMVRCAIAANSGVRLHTGIVMLNNGSPRHSGCRRSST